MALRPIPCCSASRHWLWAAVVVVGLVGALVANHSATLEAVGAEPAASSAGEFTSKLSPFVRKYCLDCHSGESAEAGIELAKLDAAAEKDFAAFLRDRRTWRTVKDKIADQEMPPADHDVQPSAAEREAVSAWIDAELAQSLCSGPKDPGRVTIRRLNRVEYNHTIRDLVGIDFQPADDFPTDDVGYGFDNIGDVLSLPPILLEKYLAAAEKIMDKAILVDDPGRAPSQKIAAEQLEGIGNPAGEGTRVFPSEGEAFAQVELPRDGDYIVQARAYGEQAGREPVRMAFRVDDKEVKIFDVPNDKSNKVTYKFKFKATAGRKKIGIAFLNDYFKPKDESAENGGDRNLLVDWLEIQGPLGLDPAKLPPSHKRIMIAEPPPDRPTIILPGKRLTPEQRKQRREEIERQRATAVRTRSDAARKIIEHFARRAFRRPVTEEEVTRLFKLWQLADKEGHPFERGIQVALTAVLVSPHFLFRIELDGDPNNPGAIYTLNDFELATRLSYFLWSSMPDDELFALAERGELRKDDNLNRQIQRMLRDPKATALVDNFAGQWLQIRRLTSMTPDKKLFPGYDDALRAAMQKETELFFSTIMVEDRSLLEFLDANWTFLNERLARHYGIDGVQGENFRRMEFAPGQPAAAQRGGILTHASILTITSNPTRTSPVKRGKWVLDNLLGTPPPPPPPNVPELSEKEEAVLSGTLRQRMEQHRTNPVCASCHQRMDPIGFGLENFDAIGAWRDKDGNFPLDASGALAGGKSFRGPAELKAILKTKQDQFIRCLTERMLTYALGRGLEETDDCTIDRISQAVARQGYRFSALVQEIVACDQFQQKRGAKTN